MKALCLLTASVLLSGQLIFAQHPLVGTWEMISGRGINAEGEKFSFDTTSVREIKIITPTHYMLIACDVLEDSLTFNRTMAGTVHLDGEKYIELPTHASVQIFPGLDVNFKWKLVGERFIQSGTIVRPDGKTIVLEELVFRKIASAKAYPENPALGTWHQVTGTYTTPDGKKATTFKPEDTRLFVITPTHWMQMDLRNKNFESARYGTYSIDGNKVQTRLDYASIPFRKGTATSFSQKIADETVHILLTGKNPEGKEAVFESVLKKAN